VRKQLLSWQWSLYGDNHTQRANLVIHILTVPLFMAGTVAVAAAGWVSPWLFAAGPAAMATAMALQGRGHGREAVAPVPFAGAGDVVSRIFLEQWVTFPRYVLSGAFFRAWRQSSK
jgi:hypothetical protein